MAQALPRCQLVPEPEHQVRFLIDGEERLTWCFNEAYPRPFFYPVIGPAGKTLTRMGHPGAPNHDHHQSLWFAHANLGDVDFWSNNGRGIIRQSSWLCYEDGADKAAMAVRLSWREGERERMRQDLVAILRPLPEKECLLELQCLLTPSGESLTIGQSNFGLLAVRVAKSLSVHFGGGKLSSSEGAEDEATGFGQYARWWDYSGPVSTDAGGDPVWNGITCFDHPANPHYPAHWHVREDGWMGPSLTRHQAITLTADTPLRLRYLLHLHDDRYEASIAQDIAASFASWPWFAVSESTKKHQAYELTPESPGQEKDD